MLTFAPIQPHLKDTLVYDLRPRKSLTQNVDVLQGVPAARTEETKGYAAAEQRLGSPDDMAQIAAFLAEEGSRWINGNSIPANGGGLLV